MSVYNSAQIAALIGIYILDTLDRIIDLKKVYIEMMTSSSSQIVMTPKLWLVGLLGFMAYQLLLVI